MVAASPRHDPTNAAILNSILPDVPPQIAVQPDPVMNTMALYRMELSKRSQEKGSKWEQSSKNFYKPELDEGQRLLQRYREDKDKRRSEQEKPAKKLTTTSAPRPSTSGFPQATFGGGGGATEYGNEPAFYQEGQPWRENVPSLSRSEQFHMAEIAAFKQQAQLNIQRMKPPPIDPRFVNPAEMNGNAYMQKVGTHCSVVVQDLPDRKDTLPLSQGVTAPQAGPPPACEQFSFDAPDFFSSAEVVNNFFNGDSNFLDQRFGALYSSDLDQLLSDAGNLLPQDAPCTSMPQDATQNGNGRPNLHIDNLLLTPKPDISPQSNSSRGGAAQLEPGMPRQLTPPGSNLGVPRQNMTPPTNPITSNAGLHMVPQQNQPMDIKSAVLIKGVADTKPTDYLSAGNFMSNGNTVPANGVMMGLQGTHPGPYVVQNTRHAPYPQMHPAFFQQQQRAPPSYHMVRSAAGGSTQQARPMAMPQLTARHRHPSTYGLIMPADAAALAQNGLPANQLPANQMGQLSANQMSQMSTTNQMSQLYAGNAGMPIPRSMLQSRMQPQPYPGNVPMSHSLDIQTQGSRPPNVPPEMVPQMPQLQTPAGHHQMPQHEYMQSGYMCQGQYDVQRPF